MATAQQPELDRANASAERTLNDVETGEPAFGKPEATEAEQPRDSRSQKLWKRLRGEVDPDRCTIQLSLFCMMTGWTDAISFAAAFVFSGFQTGNTVQLAAAIARLFSGPDENPRYFHPADRLALVSLISFVLGAFVGQFGDRIGSKTRLWVIGATALQAGLTAGAFVAILVSGQASFATDRGDIAWGDVPGMAALGLMSAAMGLHTGIVAKRLNSHYGTTVVLTTIWCELVADPALFRLHRHVPSRDHRANAILMLFIGALIGRILVGEIGSAATLGIGAGLKMLIALSFYLVPSKVTKKA